MSPFEAGAPTLAPSPGRSTVQWSIFMAGEIESERGIFRGNEKSNICKSFYNYTHTHTYTDFLQPLPARN